MRPSLLASALFVSGTLFVAALPVAGAHAEPGPTTSAPSVESVASHRSASVTERSAAWERRVLVLTNKRRAAHHLKPLSAAPCAQGFAEPWTRHMATTQVLEHQSLQPFFRCPSTMYVGENIAYGFETPRALMYAWMHSEGHRANILNPHFNRLGVAAWRATNGQTYATQDFLG